MSDPLKPSAAALSAEQALRELCALKAIKRRIELGTATDVEYAHYESNKEAAWLAAEQALRSLPDGLMEGPTIIRGPLPSQAVEEYRKRYGFLPSEESTYTLIDDVIKLLESHECRAAAKALQAAMKHIPNVPTYQPREQAARVPREFAARVRPAVKEWDIRCAQSVLKWERGEYPAHYEKLLKDKAERARVLLDEIDTILAEKEEAQ